MTRFDEGDFSMDRAFTRRRYVLNHRRGFIENDRTYYCIASRLLVTRSTDTAAQPRYLALLGRTKESIVREEGTKDNVPRARKEKAATDG